MSNNIYWKFVPITAVTITVLTAGTAKYVHNGLVDKPNSPFGDAVYKITEAQSASQAAVMFNPLLEKKSPIVSQKQNAKYGWIDQSSWSVIGE